MFLNITLLFTLAFTLAFIWVVGIGIYLAVSVLAVPDFVPSHSIKINWIKAVLWPFVIVWLAITAIWKLVLPSKRVNKPEQKISKAERLTTSGLAKNKSSSI